MDTLRQVAEMINRGHKQGPGWSLGEGPQKVEMNTMKGVRNAELDVLTDQLNRYLAADYISDDELRVAQEQLLPPLYDALRNAGFGHDIFDEKPEIYQFTADWSDRKAGEVISKEDLGTGVIFKDLLENGTIVKVDEAQNDTESVEKDELGTKVETPENSTPGAAQQAKQDAGTVGEAVVSANEPEKAVPWWKGGKK